MTFSFYYSLQGIPRDLKEAAAVYKLNWWQRLTRLELPFAAIPLVWNSMMSFGGGWFFLAASEAITVLGQDIRLPGIGFHVYRYQEGNTSTAVFVGHGDLIILVDQLFCARW